MVKFAIMLDLKTLQKKLNYKFKNNELLVLALTHRSFAANNNERLEFLGDAILSMVVAEYLFNHFPNAREGQLSRMRSGLVKGDNLAQLARRFELGSYLQLGTGEVKSGGSDRNSILADAMESIIGAIYRDSDMTTISRLILHWLAPQLTKLTTADTNKDSKTKLQELLQAKGFDTPKYRVLEIIGKQHCSTFRVECCINLNNITACGIGISRRIAEQEAARAVLNQLEGN